MTKTLDWTAPLTTSAYGPPTRIVDPPTFSTQKFVYWGDTFRAYFLDGTPYSAMLRKHEKYRLRNIGQS